MRLTLCLFCMILAWCLHAQNQVHQFILENGLKVLVKEDHRAPVAVTMVWYNVGSADEPAGITGVSHALEHLMFKGTPNYPLGVFSKTIAGIGGEENAMTNYDYTAFYEKIAASQFPLSFKLEADRMQNLLFSQEEFRKEIQVIQEERRLRTDDNPQALTFERYLAAAHLSAPYHHPVIGWMNDLKHMEVIDAQSWYQAFYAPNNATLVVVGDVSSIEVANAAKKYFSHLERRPDFIRKPQIEPPNIGVKSIEVHAPATRPMLMFGFTTPSLISFQNDWEPYALIIAAAILDGGESSRFPKNIIRKREIASSVDVYYNPYCRYQTQFIIFGIPSNTHTIDELQTSLFKELNKLEEELISPLELKRVKTQLIAAKTFEKDSILGQALEIGLLETIGAGYKSADVYIDKINAITNLQVQEVIKRYFKLNNQTQARLFPTSLSMRKEP